MSLCMCGPTKGCTWQEGQVAIGVLHKLEMFVQPFSNKKSSREG